MSSGLRALALALRKRTDTALPTTARGGTVKSKFELMVKVSPMQQIVINPFLFGLGYCFGQKQIKRKQNHGSKLTKPVRRAK